MHQTVHSQLSEGPLVQNVVVQIPKFDAKPNHNPSPNPNSNPNPMPIQQLEPWTSEPSDNWADTHQTTPHTSSIYLDFQF